MLITILFIISILLIINFIYVYYDIKIKCILYYYKFILNLKVIKYLDELLIYIDLLDDIEFHDMDGLINLKTIINNSSNSIIFKNNNNIIKYKIYYKYKFKMIVHPRLNKYMDDIFLHLRHKNINFKNVQ